MHKKILIIQMMICCLLFAACKNIESDDALVDNSDVYENVEDNAENNVVDEPAEVIVIDDSLASLSFDGISTYYNVDEKYKPLVDAMDSSCNLNDTLTYLEGLEGVFVLATEDEIIYASFLNTYEVDGVTPVSMNTTYEIGSITKQFVAVAILQLIENGKLAFDDTLDIFFPEYEYGKNITVENLLLMQSGIPDYINDMDQFFQDATDDEMMKIQGDSYTDEEFILQLSKNELLFEPGSDVMYSNTNYHLLALIIEQVTGKTYSEYISSMIFEPCEMTNSSCQTVGDVTGKSESVSTMLYFTQQNFARGCMDMHSCARDILNFEIALLNNELLSDEMTSYIFDMGIGDYKCGWIKTDEGEYFHTGSTLVYGTSVNVYMTEELGNLYLLQFHPTKNNSSYMQTMINNISDSVHNM